MGRNLIQDFLRQVQKPSSYLGTEINTINKNSEHIKLHLALIYPDLYEIGTSHFGMQILYQLLNQHPDIWAERVFAPDLDWQHQCRASQTPLFSLESQTPLKSFDILGFSLLYELNYTNILAILDLSQIPLLAAERLENDPIVIAGGPCTCNPEPVADFFDAMVIGDGEIVLEKMAREWIKWKTTPQRDKQTLLATWSQIEGVYIPSFFKPHYDSSGFQHLTPLYENHQRVRRAIIDDLENTFFPLRPTIPFGRPVHDRLRLEIARGCTRGCRFCQAGMIYRPVRERSPARLLELAAQSLPHTGYKDISLLSLSTGDYHCISQLLGKLMANYADQHVAISLPSLRAGTLTPELMNLIKKVRKTGFTIAPEAGSQRLRDVINKNVTEADILQTVEDAFRLGWQVIKLYFMIGLPTETDADLEAIVMLIKKINQHLRNRKGKPKQINVSFTTFIPKPHVPFQWVPQIPLAASQEKLNWLKKNLKMRGVFVKWQDPRVSLLEGLFARGDRRLSQLLITAYQKYGCQFDGWSDRFDFRQWQAALSEAGIDLDFYTTRERTFAEPLPWDHIDIRVTKAFLRREWESATLEKLTRDCRTDQCNQCGVCDFKAIRPVISTQPSSPIEEVTDSAGKPISYKKLRLSFSKQGPAIFFGHLELVNIFIKALNRIRLDMQYSSGFHPKPKISFGDALPIGIASLNETCHLMVKATENPEKIRYQLNLTLPQGLEVHQCLWESAIPHHLKKQSSATYEVSLSSDFCDNQLQQFLNEKEVILAKTNRKGNTRQVNLKETVRQIKLLNPSTIRMELDTQGELTLRPLEIIECIFSISRAVLDQASILKI